MSILIIFSFKLCERFMCSIINACWAFNQMSAYELIESFYDKTFHANKHYDNENKVMQVKRSIK